METLWIGDGFIGVGEDRDISILSGKTESKGRIRLWRQFKFSHFIFDVVGIDFFELGVKVVLHL